MQVARRKSRDLGVSRGLERGVGGRGGEQRVWTYSLVTGVYGQIESDFFKLCLQPPSGGYEQVRGARNIQSLDRLDLPPSGLYMSGLAGLSD